MNLKNIILIGSLIITSSISAQTWTQQAKIYANDASGDDNFGSSVAVDGNHLFIGAYLDDDNLSTNSGSVYYFTFDGTNWTQQAKLHANDANGNDNFGSSIAVDGNHLFIGAFGDDDNLSTNSGSVYYFTFDGTNWTQQAKLHASDPEGEDVFGSSMAVDGNNLFIGAYQDDDNSSTNSGSVYYFTFDGTSWTQQAKLHASDAYGNDIFGSSIAVNGNHLFIGAGLDDDSSSTNSGSVYYFTFNGTNWIEQAKLHASDANGNDIFGSSVAVDGNHLFIGAYGDDDSSSTNSGSVYYFTFDGTNWTEQAKLHANDANGSDLFGSGIAVDGNHLFIGAYQDDDNLSTNSGSVYYFTNNVGLGIPSQAFAKQTSILPNPSNGIIQITGIQKTEAVKIFNLLGEEVYQGSVSVNELLDISNLKNGLYVLKMENGNTVKFIKI